MEWADLEMNELFVPNPVNRICGRDMANRIVLGIWSPLMTVYHHTWPLDSCLAPESSFSITLPICQLKGTEYLYKHSDSFQKFTC